MSNLQTELNTYQESLHTLIASAGKFVVIKASDVVGIYDSYEDALKVGYEKFGLDPFLVKKIAPAEQVSYFTRNLAACQA